MNNINDDFQSTVFIDECSVWTFRSGLYHHRRPSSSPKANCIHPPNPEKVHCWGGISWDGPTPFYLFDYNLDSDEYQKIIHELLTPFMQNYNNGDCRFLQDNAPTHVTWPVYDLLNRNNLRWVKIKKYFCKILEKFYILLYT